MSSSIPTGSPGDLRCSLTGAAYAPGSRDDFVHQFINARDEPAQRAALGRMISVPIVLGETIQELEGHSLAEVLVDDSDASRERIERRYYLLGNTLLEGGFPIEGLAVHSETYPLMRRVEIGTNRRWHKGTALFFLGQALRLSGQIPENQQAILLALVEDVLSERSGGKPANALPAYAHLVRTLGLGAERVAGLAESFAAASPPGDGWRETDPERSYLLAVCNRRFWSMNRGPIPFISEVAQRFVRDAEAAVGTPDEVGRSLELALAYLFEASAGFRVLMRARGSDAESDLIVLNLHNEKPLEVLGVYLLVSCKNTKDKVTAQIVRDFRSRMVETKCRCGIIVARSGLTGDHADGAARAADRAALKADQPILVLDISDLRMLCRGRDELRTMLVEKYTSRLFDLY